MRQGFSARDGSTGDLEANDLRNALVQTQGMRDQVVPLEDFDWAQIAGATKRLYLELTNR